MQATSYASQIWHVFRRRMADFEAVPQNRSSSIQAEYRMAVGDWAALIKIMND